MEILKNAVEKHRELILDSERWLWAHPETGYKEWESSKYISDVFESLGYKLNKAGNIPGFYTVIDTGREGLEILILAELDSVICPTHPECNPETGAVHACGHHTQGAALIGIAAALSEPEVLNNFSGRIVLCSVPAEELLEIEYRQGLKEAGTIKYFGGKPEFMYRGYFDNVDIAFMVHSSSKFYVGNGNVGCIVKKIKYNGKPAHAGAAPHLGKNALYAALNGLNAVNAIRETFQEKDIIRVHPIITDGGQMVNAIPATATIESYVRGASF
jgi:amidohydrolase